MSDRSPSPLSRSRRIAFSALLAVAVGVAIEGLARVYWVVVEHRRARDLADRDLLLHNWYPELHALLTRDRVTRSDERFDVLVLGPSVLSKSWGHFPRIFTDELRKRHPGASVFNLSRAGHTARDSLNKYRVLDRHRFDAVIVYHSINELRANNVRPEDFSPDYEQFDWYWEVNPIAGHARLARFATLPFALRRAWLLAEEGLGLRTPAPPIHPDLRLVRYGSDVKTAASLRRQVESILEIAEERGDPVVLATFAWWIPPDYSLARFESRELDYAYGDKIVPVEVWGAPENVVAGLTRHNEVLIDLARTRPTVRLADVTARMPPGRGSFRDPCHLTRAGIAVLVEEVLAALDRPAPRP